jgi:hypothetical protein
MGLLKLTSDPLLVISSVDGAADPLLVITSCRGLGLDKIQ